MLHYQLVSGFFHLFSVPVGSENAKRKKRLEAILLLGGLPHWGLTPRLSPVLFAPKSD